MSLAIVKINFTLNKKALIELPLVLPFKIYGFLAKLVIEDEF